MELDDAHIESQKYGLFKSRRFLPIFLATFLGTFNDNMLRSGLVVLIAYSAKHGIELFASAEILVTLCSGILVLPLVIFSSVAGQVADKYEKSMLVRYVKIAEIVIMLGVAYGFYTQNILLLMFLLFISGTHTAFYLPIKFSILPQFLKKDELLAGNGFIASGSYIAILTGMMAGGILVETAPKIVGFIMVGIAISGFVASRFLPNAPANYPQTIISKNLWRGSLEIIAHAREDKALIHIIYLLSWFLVVGSVFVAQIANYASGVMKAENSVYIVFLVLFSLGMATGSLVCDKLLKGQVSTKFTNISGCGIAFFTVLMVLFTKTPEGEGLIKLGDFFLDFTNYPVVFSMFMVAVCGGVCMVPLHASLQARTKSHNRSQVIAASNLIDSLFITISTVVSAVFLGIGFGVKDLFIFIALVTPAVAYYARNIENHPIDK